MANFDGPEVVGVGDEGGVSHIPPPGVGTKFITRLFQVKAILHGGILSPPLLSNELISDE
jgi:hypothetical protein